jgi:hypothetical protein
MATAASLFRASRCHTEGHELSWFTGELAATVIAAEVVTLSILVEMDRRSLIDLHSTDRIDCHEIALDRRLFWSIRADAQLLQNDPHRPREANERDQQERISKQGGLDRSNALCECCSPA